MRQPPRHASLTAEFAALAAMRERYRGDSDMHRLILLVMELCLSLEAANDHQRRARAAADLSRAVARFKHLALGLRGADRRTPTGL
ncbi:hypothetical protein [Phenylobacterium sp.]|uniref:hypothetical protein n=1 Tax=Phenylobacterium sp. TaxID=1871053 RepID=UPI0035AFEDB6